MNESYERALNQVSLLKKALNSEKTSHQNTLQQLETTYKIIDDVRQMLKQEQQKNRVLNKQIRQKNSRIDQLSREYEDQIVDIKELIERKDVQIRKYSQVKISDYDMIRFRVISEVEAQHGEEIQQLKKQIQKQEFISNESMFEIKVLRDKNAELIKQIQQLRQTSKTNQQDLMAGHTSEINKAFGLLEQERLACKQLEKRMQRQKQKYQETIKRYHQELGVLQNELINRAQGKQNSHKLSNLTSNSSSLIQLKQSEFALESEKLKRQLKSKSQEFEELQKRHKLEVREMNRKIDETQKQLCEANFQLKQLQKQINQSRLATSEDHLNKYKRQLQKKQSSVKERYEYELEAKDRQINKLNRQIQSLKVQGNNAFEAKGLKTTQDKQLLARLERENEQLQVQLKKTQQQLIKVESKNQQQDFQKRQMRAVSVQGIKEKLDIANAQIVTLLRDKIALSQKIARLSVGAR